MTAWAMLWRGFGAQLDTGDLPVRSCVPPQPVAQLGASQLDGTAVVLSNLDAASGMLGLMQHRPTVGPIPGPPSQ